MKLRKSKTIIGIQLLLLVLLIGVQVRFLQQKSPEPQVLSSQDEYHYWFLLHRKSKTEELFHGIPNNKERSTLLKTFQVNPGIPGERPTPLPQLVGREYWVLITEEAQPDNPETAPYFLTLDVPVGEIEPYGPEPYLECNGQCNWLLPGAFGLHGTAGMPEKLTDAGSSGCIRHSDADITFLYNLLDPATQEIRYYIEDN